MSKLAIFFTIIILICWFNRQNYIEIKAKPTTTGRDWKVSGNYQNAQDAALLLEETNIKILKILEFMRKKYHVHETEDTISIEGENHNSAINLPNDVYNIVEKLIENYDPDKFYENDPRLSKDTSYTINKGDAMYVCLRERKTPDKLESPSDLLFVMLHEASHIANYTGWHHDYRFWEVFKFVLKEAAKSGIYTPIDYKLTPIDYCGLYVNYNPYFDNNIKDLGID